jgi:predicted transcriptional regulator
MGEKRAYKARKPGGGRKKLKPEYDAGKNLKDQMDAAVALYEEDCSLQSIADVLNLNPIKVRKLLITAGVYEAEVAEKVQDTFERYRKTQDYKTSILSTATVLGLSKASVTSYLPYEKGVYFPNTADKEKISVGAERQRRYRAVRKLRTEPTEEHLWEVVLLYPLKGKVYCGYCQKLMKYRVLKKLGPSFNCRFSATAVDSPCKRIPISEKMLEEIVRNALTVQIKQAEHILEILHERERKALICFSALERQEEKLSEEKAEIVKQRVALYEQYADGNMSKEEFIRQRDAYRVQEDEKMEQIQRLRTEKNQIFQPVKKDTDNLQAVMDTVGGAGDVMHLSQNVVETFIDRIEVFNDESVKIRFTFEDVLKNYEAE